MMMFLSFVPSKFKIFITIYYAEYSFIIYHKPANEICSWIPATTMLIFSKTQIPVWFTTLNSTELWIWNSKGWIIFGCISYFSNISFSIASMETYWLLFSDLFCIYISDNYIVIDISLIFPFGILLLRFSSIWLEL